AEQFGEILATGAGSIAVVRALVAAPEPEAEVARLLRTMGNAEPNL
ncbi:MAG: thiamine phosphate synthase, partial [Giesbergeria sp.]